MGETGQRLCFRRMVRSILWNTVLQIIFLGLFVFLASIDIAHPLVWLSTWYDSFFSLSTWLCCIPLCLVMLVEGIVTARPYITLPRQCSSRLETIKNLFSFNNLTAGTMYVLISFTFTWIYSLLAGEDYNSIAIPCPYPEVCLNEDRFFLMLGGIYMGVHYFVHTHLLRKKFFQFPFIQQHKLAQVKCQLFPTVKSAMRYVFIPMMIYICLYYLKGGSVRDSFCYIFSIGLPEEPMDSIFGMFKIRTLIYLWLFSSLFVLSVRLMELLFRIYMTERHEFPLHPDRNNEVPVLKEALRNKIYPIIGHLGFLDLYLLSGKSQKRREAIFSLSQPGGHPHTWNEIKEECYTLLTGFSESLEKSLKVPQTETSFIPTAQPVRMCHQYQRAASPIRKLNGAPNQLYSEDRFMADIKDWFITKLQQIKKLPFVVYFVGELPEAMTDHLLLNGLPVMWAAHSLSLLACCSLREDNYGILQNDLLKIITCLLDLKHALDHLVKHSGVMKKSPKQDVFSIKMRNSLRASVKRSLYRIAIHFKLYITDIQLPKEAELQMLSYATFREV